MASVFVALRSFFADLVSRFFLLALLVLYIVNLDPPAAFFLSFFAAVADPNPARTLGVLPSGRGSRDPALLSLDNSCLQLLPFLLAPEADIVLGGGGEEDDEEADAPLKLGLELVSRPS